MTIGPSVDVPGAEASVALDPFDLQLEAEVGMIAESFAFEVVGVDVMSTLQRLMDELRRRESER